MKGHPTSQGWTLLQTFRMPELTRSVCARYADRQLYLSFWKYDTKRQDRGESVDWEMTHEIVLQHHAVVKLSSVYMDGMLDQLATMLSDDKASPKKEP